VEEGAGQPWLYPGVVVVVVGACLPWLSSYGKAGDAMK
jgi:hypothetical protein